MISTTGSRLSSRTRAFTLVELLVVIALIVFLAGALVVTVRGVLARSTHNATLALLARLEIAIESYHAQTGKYPPDDADTTVSANRNLRNALESVRYEFKESELDATTGEILDPWGNILDYDCNDPETGNRDTTSNNSTYDLYSRGPDGVTAENDGLDNDGNALTGDADEAHLNGSVGDDINNWARRRQ